VVSLAIAAASESPLFRSDPKLPDQKFAVEIRAEFAAYLPPILASIEIKRLFGQKFADLARYFAVCFLPRF